MTSVSHAGHGPEAMCSAGRSLYERALREGRVPVPDVAAAPCLLDLGMLHPCVSDPGLLEPVAPALALHRLLRDSAERVFQERRREARLTEAFSSLLQSGRGHPDTGGTPSLSIHSGKERIDQTVAALMTETRDEILTIQPHGAHIGPPPHVHEPALRRDQEFLDRGGRIRTLYQHTLRHAPTVLARFERLSGDVEARTLDEVTERLIVLDRTVAFIPANAERTMALEVRHPALVEYLAAAFDRLWRLATPMYPQAVQPPSLNGITTRQRAIAELLVEGHTDAVIADRLGMNVRTARVHIAKLAATLGSQSRAQLGYLIGRSGILDQGR